MNQITSIRNFELLKAWSNINMFTLAQLWYLDIQTIFLYCHFFNGIPLGLQDQYLALRIRFEPQKLILRSSHAKYTLLVRCVARWNHSTCFEAEIASTWQRISRHLRSLRFAYFTLAKIFALGRVADFYKRTFCRKEEKTQRHWNLTVGYTENGLLLLCIYFILLTM